MFANEMKILTLTATTSNVTTVSNKHNYNNTGDNGNCSNDAHLKSQNLHHKLKYLHTTNKYHNHSNNNNSSNNCNKGSKKHNNNNYNNYGGNNTTTSLVNRKRYYHQQQQQKLFNNSTPTNSSNNSNHNKFVKSRNIKPPPPPPQPQTTITTTTTVTTVDTITLTPKTVDNINSNNNIEGDRDDNSLTPCSNNNNINGIATNNSTNCNNDSPSFSEKHCQDTKQQSAKKKLLLNATNTKLPSPITSLSPSVANGKNGKSKLTPSNCNGCWTNCQRSQAAVSAIKSKESAVYNTNDYQDTANATATAVLKNKSGNTNNNNSNNSSYGNKKKSYFKNSRNSSNICSEAKESKRQQQAQSDINTVDDINIFAFGELCCLNAVDSVAKTSAATTLTFQKLSCNPIAAVSSTAAAMTTALATAVTSNSTTPPNTSPSSPSDTSPKSSTNVVAYSSNTQTVATLRPTSMPVESIAGESAATIATTAAATLAATISVSTSTAFRTSIHQSSPPATVSVSATSTSTPNSYSLDFLHSVGVQMTGGASIASIKASNTLTNSMRPFTYSSNSSTNHIGTVSPARTNFNFTSATNHRQNRYLSGGQLQQQHHHHHSHHHNYQHHHHHPQPQQLTIASFMQKELTESFAAATRGSSNHGNILSTNNNGSNMSNSNSTSKTFDSQAPLYGNQQQQRYQNYYSQYQQQQQHHHQDHHSYASLQHVYNTVSEGGAGGAGRNVSNGGSGRQSYANNYHSNTSGVGHLPHYRQNLQNITSNNMQQQQHQHTPQHYQQQNKKNAFSSSSNSSCSSSSSSSTSSISSQTSATSNIPRQQHGNKSSSANANFAIETLPSKSHYASSHRGHRNHHHQHHNNPHQHHQHHQQHIAATAPSTPQHQNFYNLTYVATDSLAVPPSPPTIATIPATNLTTNSRGCSPCSPTPPSALPMGATIEGSALVLSINPRHQQQGSTHRYFQQQQQQQQQQQLAFFAQHQQQQQNFLNNHQKILNISSANSLTSVAGSLCGSNFDEATRTATGSNDSLHSSVAASSAGNSIIAGSDYDSDSTSSTHSITVAPPSTNVPRQQQELQPRQQEQLQRLKYKQLKSSLSSSSSASSTTSASSAQENVAPSQSFQNTVDFAYAFSLDPHQQFPQQFPNNHPQLLSPQQQQQQQQHQHQQQQYRNGVVSLINLSTASNYLDEEGNTLAQIQHLPQQQQQQIYFASGEHLSISAVNSAFWSPSPNSLQNSNFLYSTATNIYHTAPPSCASSTASLSPRLNEHDEPVPIEQHIQGNQFKRSQLLSTSLQRNSQLSANVGQRLRGRSQHHHSQHQQQHHHQPQQQQHQEVQHTFQQHSIFFGGGSQHLRSSSSTSSGHDFFSHTPPDRFLARAHLVEAKEMPHNLLNNTKWDLLSQGIWDKFVISQQTEETFKQKMRLWRYLYIFIKNTYPRYGLYLVGSTISGFGSDTSDVDMCLVSRSPSGMEPRQEALINLLGLRDCLAKSGEFENFNLIEAKVPILRFRDRIHQLEVDLNYNNCVGIKNTHLLYCYSQLDWRLRPLVLVTKLWAQFHNINNAKNMTISSYSLVLMVIHFLQYAVTPSVLPCLHEMFPDKFPLLRSNDFGYVDMNETIGPYESKNNQTVGELFLNFLEYYSCFDYTQFAISIRTGGLMPINVCRQAKSLKNDIHQWKELCIEEPFDLTNTARSVYDFETFERVKAVFVGSWRVLQETLDVNAVFTPITIAPQANTKLIESTTTGLPAITYSKVVIGNDSAEELAGTGIMETSHKLEENAEKEMNCINNNSNNNYINVNNNNNSSSNNNTINSSSNNNSDNNNNNNNNSSHSNNNSHKSLTALIS